MLIHRGNGFCLTRRRSGFQRNHLDGHTRSHFLNPLDDYPIPLGKTGCDQPCGADGAVKHKLALLDRIVGIHDQGGRITLGITGHGLLGNHNGSFIDTFLHHRPHEHTGQKKPFGIGKDSPQDDRTGSRIHGYVAELKRAFQGIGRVVFHN